MALTIERVALLRRVELFAATADRVLAGIARVLEEVTCPAGAVIMEAGAVEDWPFVVEHGEVEVIRPDRRVRMGVGGVVGELAVLGSGRLLARRPAACLCAYAASELAPESAAAAALTWQDAADPVLAETARSLRGEPARPSPPRVG